MLREGRKRGQDFGWWLVCGACLKFWSSFLAFMVCGARYKSCLLGYFQNDSSGYMWFFWRKRRAWFL